MGRPALNMIGKSFGRLTVESRAGSSDKHATWNCICLCGKTHIVKTKHLMSGGTNSCGCLKEDYNKSAKVHGHTKKGTKQITEYYAWHSMKDRCLRAKHSMYHRYGGRGISVCERWLHSFQNFLDDMGYKPTPKHTLDRIDNNKGYCKENCRWDIFDVQNNNRSNNVFIEGRGTVLTKAQWAKKLGIAASNFGNMLKRKSILQIIEFYEKKRNCIIC